MTAYYNEIDQFAAQWLRELIKDGRIAPGKVDERSIEDVRPDELTGFTQCHFFAGVGVWSYALRRAGWPDDRPVWTGSCPCQPFSAAGKGNGFTDERHLWPSWYWLIQQCRPATIFGEQVASKAAEPWIDLVQADLEAMDYSFGCVPFPSAGVGAPHLRDRAYWVADAESWGRREEQQNSRRLRKRIDTERDEAGGSCAGGSTGRVADANSMRRQRVSTGSRGNGTGFDAKKQMLESRAERDVSGMADASTPRSEEQRGTGGDRRSCEASGSSASDGSRGMADPTIDSGLGEESRTVIGEFPEIVRDVQTGYELPGPTNGFWRDADWLFCRDGKWRPVRPGTFPLVNGAAARVGRLRGYGNAINAEAAKTWIETIMEAT